MKKFIIALIILVPCQLLAQDSWVKSYAFDGIPVANHIKQLNDSKIIIIGDIENIELTDSDVFILKTDQNGDSLWSVIIKDPDYMFKINSGVETPDGGYIIAGTKAKHLDDYYNYRNSEIFLSKIDKFGTMEWTKSIGDSSKYNTAKDIIIDNFGDLVITGSFSDTTCLIKTDIDGEVEWIKRYAVKPDLGDLGEGLPEIYVGGFGKAVIQTEDSCFVITGTTQNHLNLPDIRDIQLIKSDINGDTLWTKTFSYNQANYANDIIEANDKGFYITGEYTFGGLGDRIKTITLKLDNSGAAEWQSVTDEYYSKGLAIVEDEKNNVFTYAYQYTNDAIIKYDSIGNELYESELGSSRLASGNPFLVNDDGTIYFIRSDDHRKVMHPCIHLIKTNEEGLVTSVENSQNEDQIPDFFKLYNNYPNPFNPVTTIRYQLPEAANVTIVVYIIMGQEVARLVDAPKQAGYHSVKWDASRFASGTYIYKITAGSFTATKRMVVIK